MATAPQGMKYKIFLFALIFSVSSYSQCFDCAHSIGGHVEDYVADIDKASDGIVLTINPDQGWGRSIYKYDFNCNLIWTNTFTPDINSSNGMFLFDTTLDNDNNIYTIISNNRGGEVLEGFTIERGNSLIKLNSDGAIEWVRKISDEYYLERKVHYWMGKIYVTGQLDEGIDTNIGLTVPNGFGSQYFIAKYDAFGNLESSKQYGENTNETFLDSKIDENGNIYFTGIVQPLSYTSNISSYLYKVNSNLNFLWSQELSNNPPDRPFMPMTLYYNISNGKIYIWSKYYKNTNFYNNNIAVSNDCEVGSIIMEISKNTGGLENYNIIDNCGFLHSVGNGTGNVEQKGFMAHEGSNLYVLSSFRGEITIGNQTVTTSQNSYGSYHADLILFKIDLTNFTSEIILRSEGETAYSTSSYYDLPGPIVAFGNSIYITSSFMSSPMTINGNTIVNNSGNNNRDILFYKHILDENSSENLISYNNTCFSSTTEFTIGGEFDSVLWNFNDPTTGINNTSALNNPTHTFSNPGVYEVSVIVKCGPETETIDLAVTISNNPSVNQIDDLYSCEDTFGSQLSSSFNTTSIEKDLIGDHTDLSIRYFDQNGNEYSNPLPNPMSNTVLAKETVIARVSYLNNPTCYTETSFNLIVQSAPEIFPLDDMYICDNDNDGFLQFDLTEIRSNLLGNQPHLNLQFYDSNNTLIPTNKLGNYKNIRANKDYVVARTINNTSACYSETTINLIVNSLPVANALSILTGCDDDGDGISEYFDVSGVAAEVLQGQSGLEINYFRSDGSEIQNFTSSYTNLQPQEETITVRLSNPDSGCYAETPLLLKTSAAPQTNSPAIQYTCDDGNGIGSFETATWAQQIIGNQTGLKVTYFDGNGNSLPTPLPGIYKNKVSFAETLIVKIENEQNTLCASETQLQLVVNPEVKLNLQNSYTICGNDPFLELMMPETFDTWEWLSEEGVVLSTTSEVVLHEEGVYSLSVGTLKNGILCEDIRSFSLKRSVLPNIREVDFREWSSRNYIEIIAEGDGDFEYSIDGINYQDSNYFEKLSGGIYLVYVRDKNGCGVASQEIILLDYPKFFSPNNDGHNDHWQLQGIHDQSETYIYIFDRYGKLLKQISTHSPGWDGTFKGNAMPADDYWFMVNLEDGREFKGNFSLIR